MVLPTDKLVRGEQRHAVRFNSSHSRRPEICPVPTTTTQQSRNFFRHCESHRLLEPALHRAVRGSTMNRMIRRSLIGSLAGGAASTALIATAGHAGVSLLLGATIGAALALGTAPASGAYLDNIMTAGALGVPLWGILTVITLPLLSGQMPEWSAAQMREHFPALVG